jgi:hypothetical protein
MKGDGFRVARAGEDRAGAVVPPGRSRSNLTAGKGA